MADYKYEVAFSFLKEDEILALQLNDLLQDRIATFIYSKKQEEIAGTDGEETFNRVFGEESRIVVVLYREKWGKTPWTKIEETAIRNRAFEEGYDFTVFIPLDIPPSVPKWLPKTQIWANLDKYGIDGAANIIETKVQQVGGTTREESLEDRATRIKREMDFEKEKEQFLSSSPGVKAANEDVEKIVETMITQINNISSKTQIKFRTEQNKKNEDRWVEIHSDTHCISVDWHYHYANNLQDSHLDVELWKDGRPREGRDFYPYALPRNILKKKFVFDRVLSENVWKSGKEVFSSKKLAEYCVKLLIDYLDKAKG